jgi:hypothetical protein
MKHRYVFRDTNEALLTILETDRPITHLVIGANLVLQTEDYAPKADTWLRVESIMLGVTSRDGALVQDTIGVICSEQSTLTTSVGQGHNPNSYRDLVGVPEGHA